MSRASQALAVLLLLNASGPAQAGWTDEVVDSLTSDSAVELGFDENGFPVAAYGEDGIRLATFLGAWNEVMVDADACARGVDLAFDATGRPALAYLGSEVRFASRGASGWTIEPVAAPGTANRISLAYTPAGEPALVWSGMDGAWYAERNAGIWSVELIRYGAALNAMLTFDASGSPLVLWLGWVLRDWFTPLVVEGARRSGGGWTVSVEVDAPQPFISAVSFELATAASGELGLAVVYGDDLQNQWVEAGVWDGSSWNLASVFPGSPTYLSAAASFDGTGKLAVGVRNGLVLSLYVQTGSTWAIEHNFIPASDHIDLAYAPGGEPWLTWKETASSRQLTGHRVGTTWPLDTLISPMDSPGALPQLRHDPAGRPAIVHGAGAALRLSRFDGSAWSHAAIATVDPLRGTALSFDLAGAPAVAWTDTTALYYAPESLGNWPPETVATPAPKQISMVHDGTGTPAIAGLDGSTLKVWRKVGASWSVETVASGILFTNVSNLVVTPGGDLSLAWLPDATRELVYAERAGGAWTAEAVSAGPEGPGLEPTLAWDGAGNPWIAHRLIRPYNEVVRLSNRDAGVWRHEDVNLEGYTLQFVLSPLGEPVLLTRNGVDVWVRWRQGTSWGVLDPPEGMSTFSMAMAPSGQLQIAGRAGCAEDLRLFTLDPRVIVRRGIVASLAPGWKAAALPLSDANDDQTGGFPQAGVAPGQLVDAGPAPPPQLTLYVVDWATSGAGSLRLNLIRTAAGEVSASW